MVRRGFGSIGALIAVAAVMIALAVVASRMTAAWDPAPAAPLAPAEDSESVVLAGGCFWGMEAVFESLKGVSSAVAGYSGGAADTAHYEMVSTGQTGHAESVEVTYDPSVISFDQLLKVYFLVAHDPTELNYQGPDYGSQYRSEIYYTSDAQRDAAQKMIADLTRQRAFAEPIVTLVAPLRAFYPAEEYHQHFVQRNPSDPYVVFNDLPKLAALRKQFPDLVR
jgi:peptide-methionine (S)-S-oxide reductase